jgi:predicted N-formylglutamate amidohydrolase
MYETEAALDAGAATSGAETAAGLGAVELCNIEGAAPLLLLCDHAGRQIPAWLGDLGLPERERARHIGWDIGAADVTRALARLLDAPAVLCHTSRLVIDANRRPGEPTSIPRVSDGTIVPANQEIDAVGRRRRARIGFLPYHRAIARQIGRLRRHLPHPAVISVHSCTEVMGGVFRPWHVGVLWNRDERLARPVMDALAADPALNVGANQPYSGRIHNGYSIPFHAERAGLPHVTFEMRQDLIDCRERAELWARRLAAALRRPLADPLLHRRFAG